jgi:DNA-binding GntR family transcriptional regulator
MLANHAATAQQEAYIYLQDQIVSGVLPGGCRLQLEEISKSLGVSRMPIREAIRQLDAEGYVTIRPNRGAVVTSRTPKEVLELFEMRAVLEGLAARVAVPNVTIPALEDIELDLARLRRLERQSVAWVERHDALHDVICRLSGRTRLCTDIGRLRLAARPYLRLYANLHANPEIKGHEHERIIDALRSGDGNRAERVMRDHIMANAEAIASCLPLSQAEPVVKPRVSRTGATRASRKNGRTNAKTRIAASSGKRRAHRRPRRAS